MAEEKGSVQLGKSLLSQAQSRTRRLQKSSDKKFYGALAIGGYDAYSKTKGVKAYEELEQMNSNKVLLLKLHTMLI